MAKAVILYFSQCGHTKELALRISKRLEAINMGCDIFEMPGSKPESMAEYKIVFIGSPVYYFREPMVWESYVKSLPDMTGKAGFIFSTHGAPKEKHVDKTMNDNLAGYFADKGLKILSSYGTVSEDTWTPFKKIGKGKGRPNEQDIDSFDLYIERIFSDLKNGKTERAIYDFSVKHNKHILTNFITSFFIKISPKPKVDRNNCIKCGVCVKNCPVGNIVKNEEIKINSNCIKCYECERSCSKNAIKVNWKLFEIFIK